MPYTPIGKNYQKSPPPNVSYDFIDTATGVGYVTIHLGDTADNKIMSNGTWYSHTGFTGASDAGTIDIDFDMLFGRTITLEGKLIASISYVGENGGAGSADVATTCTVYVRKWDGVSETEIANENATLTATSVGIDKWKYLMGSVDITIPNTPIKKGESLRITIDCTATASANRAIHIMYDPKDNITQPTLLVGATGADNTYIDHTSFLLPIRIDS